MKYRETCTCGSEIDIEHDDPETVRAEVDRWRAEHPCLGPQVWRRSALSTTDTKVDFGFVPNVQRPVEAM